MKTFSQNIILKNSVLRVALGTAALLLIPLLGRWPWSVSDFVIMGTMLFVFGTMLDLVIRKSGKYRIAAAFTIVFLFLWLWAELAVGVFTNWGS